MLMFQMRRIEDIITVGREQWQWQFLSFGRAQAGLAESKWRLHALNANCLIHFHFHHRILPDCLLLITLISLSSPAPSFTHAKPPTPIG